jgi:hypothetical protein
MTCTHTDPVTGRICEDCDSQMNELRRENRRLIAVLMRIRDHSHVAKPGTPWIHWRTLAEDALDPSVPIEHGLGTCSECLRQRPISSDGTIIAHHLEGTTRLCKGTGLAPRGTLDQFAPKCLRPYTCRAFTKKVNHSYCRACASRLAAYEEKK